MPLMMPSAKILRLPMFLGVMAIVNSQVQGVTITGNYIAPGSTFPSTGGGVVATAPPTNATGGGSLTAAFATAAGLWQGIIGDDHTVSVSYGWTALGPGIVASTSVTLEIGNPQRIYAVNLMLDSDQSTAFFMDPTPSSAEEWNTFTPYSADLGGGTINTGRTYTGSNTTGVAGNWDMVTVLTHELGHALGLASSMNAYTSDAADNDIDVTAPRPDAGTAIPVLGPSNAHISNALPNALMIATPAGVGERLLPSDADILAITQVSQFVSVNLTPSWLAAAGGNWSAAGNWTGSPLPPNAVGAVASFGMATSSPILVDAPVTVGTITFMATSACTINGPAGITMQTASGPAVIDLQRALTQTISAPLTLASNTNITGIGTLATGSVTNNAALSVQATVNAAALGGTGTTSVAAGHSLTADSIRQIQLTLAAGATVTLRQNGTDANYSRVGAVVLSGNSSNWTSKLDVNDNKLIIDNANSAVAATTYTNTLSQLKQGFDNGAWDGQGIVSTKAQTNVNNGIPVTIGVINNDDGSGNPAFFHDGTDLPQFAGQTVNGTDVLSKYTYFGDADLSGTVDAVDYSFFVAGVQSGGSLTGWEWGDFDYSGTIDAVDYSFFVFGVQGQASGSPLAADDKGPTSVPEPASLVVLAMGLSGSILRRRRGVCD